MARKKNAPPTADAPQRDPDFLTIAEVSDHLRCSDKTIRRRICAKKIPAIVEGGRILIALVDYWAYVDHLRRARKI